MNPAVRVSAVALARVGWSIGLHDENELLAYVMRGLANRYPRVPTVELRSAATYGTYNEINSHTHFGAGDVTVDPATGVGAIAGGVKKIVTTPLSLLKILFQQGTWIRVLLVILGTAALIGALIIFARELGVKGVVPHAG